MAMIKTKMPEERIKEEEAMRQAVAAYVGPITRCAPGKARGEPMPAADRAARWLERHQNDQPIKDQKVARRRMRMAQQKQARIAKQNAPLLKRIAKHERTLQRNMAFIKQETAR